MAIGFWKGDAFRVGVSVCMVLGVFNMEVRTLVSYCTDLVILQK